MYLMRRFKLLSPAAFLFSACLYLVLAPSAAVASSITVGFGGGASVDPAADGVLTAPAPLPGDSLTLDLNLNLSGAEVASIFQADFVFQMVGDWTVALDLTQVDPGVSPFGVGTWPGGVGLNTGTQANLSLTSGNAGGERLVAQLVITLNASAPGDLFSVSLTTDAARIIVEQDIVGGVQSVPFSTLPGQLLVSVPEPNSALLLGSGLLGLAMFIRSRSA